MMRLVEGDLLYIAGATTVKENIGRRVRLMARIPPNTEIKVLGETFFADEHEAWVVAAHTTGHSNRTGPLKRLLEDDTTIDSNLCVVRTSHLSVVQPIGHGIGSRQLSEIRRRTKSA